MWISFQLPERSKYGSSRVELNDSSWRTKVLSNGHAFGALIPDGATTFFTGLDRANQRDFHRNRTSSGRFGLTDKDMLSMESGHTQFTKLCLDVSVLRPV